MLDALINRWIQLDPDAAELLAPLLGRRVRLSVEGFPQIVVRFSEAGVSLCGSGADADAEIDAEVSASREALGALLTQGGDAVGRLRIRGEVAVVEHLRNLVSCLRPDWQEPLARLLGDPLAQWSADTLRSTGRWLSDSARQGASDLGEWLTEESGLVPEPQRARAFLEEVDHLRADADRLAVRIQRLERGRG
ncbi:ubiquinone biosynthesis accessory factor UbiJ [Halorhodospira halophila]|uniref:Ubiquinone biosynthesis accessory factor UbiJ n=1 Tax=Halorhodospira halophila (strain DSM 244 / SL1) TaxID=349124 RepID=A1WWB9_HALHL|nr:SCP2 sterol-binding domain-containing protein [Halorhodospira halophila]ABM61981.1 protein of unknown function DUF1243 [Halorhodospira halophila SL1]MBK1729691.1 hypothetical protein [Halorhodospira halophila]